MKSLKKDHRHSRLARRDILKLMVAMPGAAFISASTFASLLAKANPSQPDALVGAAVFQPKVLDPHQWQTLRVLCDLIIPADDVSGSATQAGVPEFIDDWLDFKGGDLPHEIQSGLTWLDTESNRSFSHLFIDCPIDQQKRILDRIAYPRKAATEDAGGVAFFNQLRDLVVSGFYTSEIGIADLPYLGNEPQSEWHGCPEDVITKLALESTEKTT
jgi:gluconate 2-dehydrogenase subunit 3-like protein